MMFVVKLQYVYTISKLQVHVIVWQLLRDCIYIGLLLKLALPHKPTTICLAALAVQNSVMYFSFLCVTVCSCSYNVYAHLQYYKFESNFICMLPIYA